MERRWIALDIETIPNPDAVAWLGDVTANRTLKDPAKIAADLEAKKIAQAAKMALDPWAARPIVIAVQTERDETPLADVCETDARLRDVLRDVFALIYPAAEERRTLVGFRVRGFDWLHLAHHGRRLGLAVPRLSTQRYANPHMADLYDLLCDDDCEHVVARSLRSTCRVYGLDQADDDCDGADVSALVAAGDLAAVVKHCVADVQRTVALARFCGVIGAGAADSEVAA